MTLYNTKLPTPVSFYDFNQVPFGVMNESGISEKIHHLTCNTVGDVLKLVKDGFITIETARFELRRMGLELEDDCDYYYTYDLRTNEDEFRWTVFEDVDCYGKIRIDKAIEVIRKK